MQKNIWVLKAFLIPSITLAILMMALPYFIIRHHTIYITVDIYSTIMFFLLVLRSKDSWFFEPNETFDKVVTILIWIIASPIILMLGLIALFIITPMRFCMYVVGYIFSMTIVFIFGIRLRVVGKLPKGQFIVTPNHCSTIDDILDFIIMGIRKWKVVFAEEVIRIPFARYFLRYIGIPISRTEITSRLAVTRKMLAELKKGYNLLIFPEGRRLPVENKENYLCDFDDGAFFLSKQNDVCIVPVVISWTFLFKPRSGQWWFSPRTITIYYLEPTKIKNEETIEQFKNRVRELMLVKIKKSVANYWLI